jgi:hypothetical protein
VSESKEVRLARLDERQKADRRALKLQTRELARRLDDLNHAQRLTRERDQTFVSAEKFDDFVARYNADREAVAKALTLAEGNKQGTVEHRTGLSQNATLALAALAIVVTVLIANGTFS